MKVSGAVPCPDAATLLSTLTWPQALLFSVAIIAVLVFVIWFWERM